ncbi:nucleotidyl transferase AbiEii/AbiGii toxin family protein [Ohessyouella blattaphilus]|uniref:Nucleotidyl transferase AbiEii/AbiGii toxin family protein n=2 Tax=Bacteria TaxID=2 RepID=A0ABT1EK08_9FIRM|nr:nucleotidyl transferase AbiEii/AbiGii toxin family protein [Ohessyouella blattaphilus]MCP1111037.1 nucleotidyl transferase AbiEii/AbiGii toxin family protein [Ohessyouella blattaphilus]MCR8564431.1 nucleotidyl transferase AbiEii/AbiGii toxin family protein [Ohessyouella blattaphilus]MDL2250452.1 nucleotidyl transferase AbiEii/AbiGii toxin family protein [Lachnospiraceae bacterium OttesenSCG-928-J05]
MNLIEQMITAYDAPTIFEQKNVLKEVMQEIVLCGLSRADFFAHAAFYGGTALRIFYGLDRFSEDLDFSLIDADPDFNLSSYFPILEKEIQSYGLRVQINTKKKTKDSDIQSAFLKGNTKEHLLMFYPEDSAFSSIPKNEVIKIKFEVDVNPPKFATFERKYRLQPVPYEVNLYDEPSLFAGKIHAVIGRSWKNRTKGRDLYDFIFYRSRGIAVNEKHLRERLLQSGHIKEKDPFNANIIRDMLCDRFKKIDYLQAKEDVAPFIRDPSVLNIWSSDFFEQITKDLQTV